MPELTVEPAKPTTPEGLVEDYLASCRARGLSPKTKRDNYAYALKSMFLPWAATDGITEPEQITSRVMDASRLTCWSTVGGAARSAGTRSPRSPSR